MTAYTIWTKEEYQERASVVAPKLLGQYLIHCTADTTYIGRIVETEAYGGSYRRMADDGAHSFRGLTKRTEPMFCAGGVSYVYLIYGMYHCVNIVTGPEGSGQAVLIRAVEPVAGIEHMLENRRMQTVKPAVSNGPGKLCRAMAITLAQNRLDLCGSELYIARPAEQPRFAIVRTTRINIDYAVKGKQFPWRFYIKDNSYVSIR
ncbi:DNA-3-methyladenine glycosylase [uncultured Megasphaera sp.]|uniref:DNA-3-methyladenine glycosylase n=1 Tax=uncultured Megasphaera sp. TaxID=165188 RepID=UPI00265D1F8C|nr:DNA-3-methyladenine glycosylase [uncultured Megasphaera sp.]